MKHAKIRLALSSVALIFLILNLFFNGVNSTNVAMLGGVLALWISHIIVYNSHKKDIKEQSKN